MDFILSLVKILCGSSTAQEDPQPIEFQKRPSHQHRPATQTQWVTPEHRRQEQEWKPTTFQPPSSRPEHKSRQDQNQVNQHEGHYTALRTKANEHGDLMARCFQESHEAYNQGDHARAKELSAEGKQHERKMESLNAEASAWIFRQNNLDSKPGEVDLHGLYVKEAVSYVEKSIEGARRRGDAEIRLIVGKGLHSDGHVAKIKPVIEDLMRKQNIPTEIDPHNGGVLVARLS